MEDRKRKRLPLRSERPSDSDETRDSGFQHTLVELERQVELIPASAQLDHPFDECGVGLRAEQPVDRQLENGTDGSRNDRSIYDERMTADEPLPKPFAVVRLSSERQLQVM